MRPMRRTVALLLIGFLLGLGTFWVGAMVTGGWYSYQHAASGSGWLQRVQEEHCEPFAVKDIVFIRCPRFR